MLAFCSIGCVTSDDERDLRLIPACLKAEFSCPRCGVFADQAWRTVFTAITGGLGQEMQQVRLMSNSGRSSATTDSPWRASVCRSCDTPTLWRGDDIVWPLRVTVGPDPNKDIPEQALELYNEGREVAAVSRRAGAALLRAALERLINYIEPGSGRLNDKIGRLRERVSPGLAKALDILRDTGNGILHDEVPEGVAAVVVSESGDQSAAFDYLCGVVNRLTTELITTPLADDELFALLPDSVRAAIARRDST